MCRTFRSFSICWNVHVVFKMPMSRSCSVFTQSAHSIFRFGAAAAPAAQLNGNSKLEYVKTIFRPTIFLSRYRARAAYIYTPIHAIIILCVEIQWEFNKHENAIQLVNIDQNAKIKCLWTNLNWNIRKLPVRENVKFSYILENKLILCARNMCFYRFQVQVKIDSENIIVTLHHPHSSCMHTYIHISILNDTFGV